jgi:hypothetical protein
MYSTFYSVRCIEWQLVQLFYHVNADRFLLLLPLECSECNTICAPITTRATPASTGNRDRATHSTYKKQEI